MHAFLKLIMGGVACLFLCHSLSVLAKEQRVKQQNQLPAQVASAFQQAEVPLSAVSILITPLESPSQGKNTLQRPRLSHRANTEMNPASVMKLITSSAGLSILGPDFTWRNRVLMDGPVINGVLQGNLYFYK